MFNIFLSKLKKNWPWLSYFFIFGITFIVFLYILVPPGVLCPDGFYHTKMALLIKENGLVKNFPWTQFTTYKDLFVDHHFLYHFLLIPFLKIPSPQNLDYLSLQIEPLIKTKLAVAVFAGLAILAIFWFCRKLKVKKAFLWTCSAFLIPHFLLRLSLIRAPALSIVLLILGLYFILKEKYLLLFILSFLYVWTYGAWPLMLVIVFIYCFANAIKKLIDKWSDWRQKFRAPSAKLQTIPKNQNSNGQNILFKILKIRIWNLSGICYLLFGILKSFFNKTNIKLLLTCILGLSAGLIINPYFPQTLPFYWLQTFKIGFLNYHNQIGVGAEWYPYNFSEFIINTLPLLAPWVVSFSWFVFSIKKQKKQTWLLVLVSLFFLFYTLKARRNIEYFIPMAIIFNGLIFNQIGKQMNWKKIKDQLKTLFASSENIFYVMITALFILCFSISLGFYLNQSIKNLYQKYQQNYRSVTHLQKASLWIKNNTQPKEIIFQSNWGIFPELFYFNSQNYYINGLDQTFMYEKNKNLYQTWQELIYYQTTPDKTAQILQEKFQAKYVLVEKHDKKFAKLLKKSQNLKKVYKDNEATIYQINYVP